MTGDNQDSVDSQSSLSVGFDSSLSASSEETQNIRGGGEGGARQPLESVVQMPLEEPPHLQEKMLEEQRPMPPHFSTVKAYDNRDWLHSRGARHVRIMCEYLETQTRLRREGVMCSILFFGSARGVSREVHDKEVTKTKEALSHAATAAEKEELEAKLDRLHKTEWMTTIYDKTRVLSRLVTEWAETEEARTALSKILEFAPSAVSSEGYAAGDACEFVDNRKPSPLVVCTGGGPGLMEAANRGAYDVPGGRSAGMGISLPFEKKLNRYITPDLGFEFHYFFTRKFWMVYICLGLVVMPGGFGTLDELTEVLTLKQTGKFKRNIPVVMFGEFYWRKVVNFEAMAELGTVATKDLEQLYYTDDPHAAFEHIRRSLLSDSLIYRKHKSMLPKTTEEVKLGRN